MRAGTAGAAGGLMSMGAISSALRPSFSCSQKSTAAK